MILELHRQGLSPTAIARQLGIDRKTVRKYITRDLEPPGYGPRQPRTRAIDSFLPYLRGRLAAYPALTAVRLWREGRERGFVGGYTTVKRAVRDLRPAPVRPFEVRFKTPPGEQAQVDLARSFRDLDDLNAQLRLWLDTVANPRVHATTGRVVNEAFAEERAALRLLPLAPYRAVLTLERRLSHEGMVRVGGNLYSVPDTARRRVLEVQCGVEEIRILEDGIVIGRHARRPGRGRTSIDPAHRKTAPRVHRGRPEDTAVTVHGAGDVVARRSLDFYDALGRVMAGKRRA